MGSFVLLAMIPQLDWPSLTKVRGVDGGRSSENNAIRSLPASKNRRPRFLPERDVKANFTNFRIDFPKMSWSMLCCPEISNTINQYIYASLHTNHKYGCLFGSTSVGLEFWLSRVRQNLESQTFTVMQTLCLSLWTQNPKKYEFHTECQRCQLSKHFLSILCKLIEASCLSFSICALLIDHLWVLLTKSLSKLRQ